MSETCRDYKKIDEIYWEYCAPNSFRLQDYIEVHGQQNIKNASSCQLMTFYTGCLCLYSCKLHLLHDILCNCTNYIIQLQGNFEYDCLRKTKYKLFFLSKISANLSSVQDNVHPSTLYNTGLFISPSGISELDCATTSTDTAERSISIGRESLQVFFVLGALVYFQVPPLGGSRE